MRWPPACRYRRRSSSSRATWSRHPVLGQPALPACVRWRKILASSRVWASVSILRKSGIWQTSQSSRTRRAVGRHAPRSRIARRAISRARWSSARAPASAPVGAGARRGLRSSARTDRNRSSRVAPHASARQRLEAVVLDRLDRLGVQPAQLGRWCRRCRRSCGGRRGRRSGRSRSGAAGAGAWPSNLCSSAKATWSTSMLSPMPMASVATR